MAKRQTQSTQNAPPLGVQVQLLSPTLMEIEDPGCDCANGEHHFDASPIDVAEIEAYKNNQIVKAYFCTFCPRYLLVYMPRSDRVVHSNMVCSICQPAVDNLRKSGNLSETQVQATQFMGDEEVRLLWEGFRIEEGELPIDYY